MIKPTLTFILPAALLAMMYCKPAKKATSAETAPPPAVTAVPAATVNPEAQLQMEIANTRWPGTQTEELREGHAIYTTKCTACHKPFEITRFNEFKWLHEIDDMSPKAKLTAEEKLKLTKYILSYRETKEKMKAH